MHRIELSIQIRCPRAKVFEILVKVERFPDFMKFVKNIKVLERHAYRRVTFWELEIGGAPLSWRQEDIIDEQNCEVRFKMIEGDYQHYEGSWRVTQIDDCHVGLMANAQFDWGIPILEEHVRTVLERKARLALTGMLTAIKQKGEAEYV